MDDAFQPDVEEQREQPDPPKRWGVGHAVVGYIVSYVLAGIAVGIYSGFADVGTDERTLGLIVALFIGMWVGMVGTLLYATSRQPGGTLRSEFGFAFKPVDAGIGFVAGVASQFVLLPLVYLPWFLFSEDFSRRLNEPAKELTNVAEGTGYILLAILIAIGAPLIEELFFRGLLQRSLLRFLHPAVAIGLTALLFGLAHQRLITLPGLTAFGIVVGVLAYKTGRLGPAIATHFFFNLATVVALA